MGRPIVMRYLFNIFVLLLALATVTARAAHTQAQLFLSADPVKPGDTVYAAVDMKMDPGWHTYWKNPGSAGQATEIKWQLPAGVTAGEIQWPLPGKLPPADITTYGYENEVVLIVPLKVADNVPAGPLNIAAKVSWLECNESCIPAKADVQATLNVGTETKPSANIALINTWKAKVPKPAAGFTTQAFWQGKPATDDTRPLLIQADWQTPRSATGNADFYPAASDAFEVQSDTKVVANNANEIQLGKQVKKYSGDWPQEISGVLVAGDEAYDVKLQVLESQPVKTAGGLWLKLLSAFIGGLILNIMPCVLPVIALKILGFVNEAGGHATRVRTLGIIYGIGVLVSFLILAAITVAIKAAGHRVGWGMQFSSPIFVVVLATLITLVALNLFGVFEVILGGGALDAAGKLASRQGVGGAFFNGILATILATPCTAPFLSQGVGVLTSENNATIFLIFIFVGLGLAAPYVLLSWNLALLKFLPKPGAWMEKFKMAMGFPMLIAVVWLCDVAVGFYGDQTWWLGVFLVIVGATAWIYGTFVQRGQSHKLAGAVVALFVFAGGYAFALEKQLNWRGPLKEASSSGTTTTSSDQIDWQPWSPEAIAKAQSEGRPVLVDFTARWCTTCRVNAFTSIDISSVRTKLKAMNAVTLIADYTRQPDNMTAELNRFGRPSVPLVLVYPKTAGTDPIVLPETLTPGTVLSALDNAAM